MEKVVVWEKKVVLYTADSARWTKNESSEYLNHITSKNTHKTPKLWKLCYGTKLVTGKKRTEGHLHTSTVLRSVCTAPRQRWLHSHHSSCVLAMAEPHSPQALLPPLELLRFGSGKGF